MPLRESCSIIGQPSARAQEAALRKCTRPKSDEYDDRKLSIRNV
jgi:hypothetical protein